MPAPGGSRAVGIAGSHATALTALMVVTLGLGPPTVMTAAVTVVVITSGLQWHWQEVAASAAAATGAAVAGVWVATGDPVGFHYSGFLSWLAEPSLSPTDLLPAWASATPMGVPAGVVLGAGVVGLGQARATGAEWHPLERRRQSIDAARRTSLAAGAVRDPDRQSTCSITPLGAVLGGDLDWSENGYATWNAQGNGGVVVAGASGSGKTVTLERLVIHLAATGRRVVYADCKGTDPDLDRRIVAAYITGAGRDDIVVHRFPDEALNGWVGDDRAIANRLVATQDVTEPFYESAGEGAVRLAIDARVGDRGPCRSSADFVSRLNIDFLMAAWRGTAREHRVAALRQQASVLNGLMLRYGSLFDAIGGGFDGNRSFGDSDVVFLGVPTLAAKADAKAIMRFLLADFSHYCTDPDRKPRQGSDVVLIIDEASAISGMAPQITDLAERVRDVGGQVMVAVQSYEGLGDDEDQRRRLRNAMAGGIVLHRMADPEELVKAAGAQRVTERSFQLERDTATSGMGSMRMAHHYLVDPDMVRRADVGEAFLIHGGRYLHMLVIANPAFESLALAEALLAQSRLRGAAQRQPDASPTSESPGNEPAQDEPPPPKPQGRKPGWLDDLEEGGDDDS